MWVSGWSAVMHVTCISHCPPPQTNYLWAIGFFSCRLHTWAGKEAQTNYPQAMGLFSCRLSIQLTWNKLLALRPKECTHVQMKMCSIWIITGVVLRCTHGFDWSLVVNVNHEQGGSLSLNSAEKFVHLKYQGLSQAEHFQKLYIQWHDDHKHSELNQCHCQQARWPLICIAQG